MSGNVASEEHADLNVVLFEKPQQSFSVRMEQRKSKPVELVVPLRQHVACPGFPQLLAVSMHVPLADRLELVQLCELCQAKGCRHLTSFHVVAQNAVEKLEVILDAVHRVGETFRRVLRVVAHASPVPELQRFHLQLRIVEHDNASHASRSDDVRCVERDNADVRFLSVRHRIAGILEQPNSWRCSRPEFLPINLAASKIRNEDALGAGRYGRKYLVYTGNVSATRFHVDEDRFEAELLHWCN
mmetsp:Transcript_3989/g.11137  ORF Transcript_3989/g.11137 Transcript_3989/m.11137 type:complete len:243 (+) Transcript_3989:407-1135(+)